MFGLFKKEITLVSPATGTSVDLSEVKDEVFSKKMMGDGVAIRPTDGTIVAPCDGNLSMVFETGHAFGMTLNKNIELLIHIGIDTVELQGQGFEVLKTQGQDVKQGEPIIRVDFDLLASKGYDIITPIIVTAPENSGDIIKKAPYGPVSAGATEIYTINP